MEILVIINGFLITKTKPIKPNFGPKPEPDEAYF